MIRDLQNSRKNRYFMWKNDNIVQQIISYDIPWRTLTIMRAIVAKSEDLDLLLCHRFIINDTSYFVFHQTIVPWMDLTRRQKFCLLIMPSVGLKIESRPPSYVSILSEEEKILRFQA